MSHSDPCPYCGRFLTGMTCRSCDVEFAHEPGTGKLTEQMFLDHGAQPSPPRPEHHDFRCIGCDLPLKTSSIHTSAWEDGDNPDAYITCADCGAQNFVES